MTSNKTLRELNGKLSNLCTSTCFQCIFVLQKMTTNSETGFDGETLLVKLALGETQFNQSRYKPSKPVRDPDFAQKRSVPIGREKSETLSVVGLLVGLIPQSLNSCKLYFLASTKYFKNRVFTQKQGQES